MPRLSDHTFPRPVTQIEVAPGTKVLPVDMRRVPALGIFEWQTRTVTLENGRRATAFFPIMRVKEAWLRVSEAEKLPLGMSAEVIVRLIRGGFVEGGQAAPNNTTVNILSLLEHIEATREDPDYWTPERRKRFKEGM